MIKGTIQPENIHFYENLDGLESSLVLNVYSPRLFQIIVRTAAEYGLTSVPIIQRCQVSSQTHYYADLSIYDYPVSIDMNPKTGIFVSSLSKTLLQELTKVFRQKLRKLN